MIFRRCSAGHDIEIHIYPYDKIIAELMTDPEMPYCVLVAGEPVAECNDLLEADTEYLAICECNHAPDEPIQGRMQIGLHHHKNTQVVPV